MRPLNERQLQAAHAPLGQPLKLIAGAGTGKTETLAQRFVHLVAAGQHPGRILMLTFTEKAAAEMRGRVTARLLERWPDLPLQHLLHPWIHTFHGFCARVLVDHTLRLRLASPPRVLEDWERRERWELLWQEFEQTMQLAAGWQPYRPAQARAFEWHAGGLVGRVISLVEQLRGLGLDAQALLRQRPPADHEQRYHEAYGQLRPLVGHCFEAYRATLQAAGALDFAELVLATIRLLEDQPAVAQQLRHSFDALLVDEFQDTDRAQLRLLELLDPGFGRTTIVGDPRQALYGWRQARVENMLDFPGPVPVTLVTLRDNYRSLHPICELANRALAGYRFDQQQPEFDLAEGLLARRDPQTDPSVQLRLMSDLAAEASYVAATAARLAAEGRSYGQMALLLRSRTHLRLFEDALLLAGVPYEVVGGPGFYELREVRTSLAMLRLLSWPADGLALLRLLESDVVGLPDGALACARRPAGSAELLPLPSLEEPDWQERWRALLPEHWAGRDLALQRLAAFAELYHELRLQAACALPARLLQTFWDRSGLRGRLLSAGTPGAQRRLLCLEKLLRLAESYTARNPLASLPGLARYLGRLAASDDEPLPGLGEGHAALQVLTVHAAKGREFEVVFVADTRLPRHTATHVNRTFFDQRYGLIISEDDRHAAIGQLRAEVRRRALNEECCIWYVALTRARDRLYVLHETGSCALDAAHGELRFVQPARQSHPEHFFHQLWNQLQACDQDWCAAIELADGRNLPPPTPPQPASGGHAPQPGGLDAVQEQLAQVRPLAQRLAALRAQALGPQKETP